MVKTTENICISLPIELRHRIKVHNTTCAYNGKFDKIINASIICKIALLKELKKQGGI